MSNLHDCCWPSEIFISVLQIVECPILVPVFSLFASVTADIILDPSASSELDWSGANFTLYSIYTHSVLCCSFFFFLLFPLYLNFFLAHANICKDTHTNLAVHTLVIHWRALYQFRRQKRQHSCCVWCVHGLKASAFSPEASPLHVTATCRVCSNEH